MQLESLVHVLQVAVGPVILISGVGLLLLSMTNRFGRVIDRSRQLKVELRPKDVDPEHRSKVLAQLRILMRRAYILRASITMAVASVLLAALLIIFLFVSALLDLAMVGTIATLFCSCLGSLIAALVVFLRDINLSLKALKLEVGSTEMLKG